MDNIISTTDLLTGYSGHEVMGPVSLSIPENKLITLIGENGSGKSTLMKTLAGIIPSLSGRILLYGKDLNTYHLSELSTKRSMLSTHFEGYVNYNLIEILSISRYPFTNWLGEMTKKDEEMIHRSLEITGLSSLAKRMIYELSDGEKQKLLIARSYCQDTPLIFFDEPFIHLDIKQKRLIYELIDNLVSEQNKTVLTATHDMEFVNGYSDAVMAIHPDKHLEVYDSDAFTDKDIDRIFDLRQETT